MMRCPLLVLAAFLLTVPAPAREPSIFGPLEQKHDLAGSVWIGDDGPIGQVRFKFERGGVLEYSYRGTTFRTATWKQAGDRIYFQMNDKYRECEAIIQGLTMRGSSWNKAGKRWTTTLKPETRTAPN